MSSVTCWLFGHRRIKFVPKPSLELAAGSLQRLSMRSAELNEMHELGIPVMCGDCGKHGRLMNDGAFKAVKGTASWNCGLRP